MSKTAATTPKPNIYQIVTDRIIQSLKAGVIPWEKPWKTPHFNAGPFPRNFRTGKPYRGVNILLLWSSPYSSPFWLTFKQAQELKGVVRKGERGTQIVFYKQLHNRKDDEKTTDNEKERAPFVLCYYTVFNVEQCDGLTLGTNCAGTEGRRSRRRGGAPFERRAAGGRVRALRPG